MINGKPTSMRFLIDNSPARIPVYGWSVLLELAKFKQVIDIEPENIGLTLQSIWMGCS